MPVLSYDTKKEKYYVFVTTDLTVTGRQIIKTYELRPEIEEDFRQLKAFWKLSKYFGIFGFLEFLDIYASCKK